MFTHVGNITVEKKDDLEHAMEDAINIGAEDVEEFEENNIKYFQVCYIYIYLYIYICIKFQLITEYLHEVLNNFITKLMYMSI